MKTKDGIRVLNLDEIIIGEEYDAETYQPAVGITVTGVWTDPITVGVSGHTHKQEVQFAAGMCVEADAPYIGLVLPHHWYITEGQYGRQGGLIEPVYYNVQLTNLELERVVAALDMAREYLSEHLTNMSVYATIYMETYFNDAGSDHKRGLDTTIFNDFAKLKKKFEKALKD